MSGKFGLNSKLSIVLLYAFMTILLKRVCTRSVERESNNTYWIQRNALMEDDASNMLGSDLVLTAQEESLNSLLMGYKNAEFAEGFQTPFNFLPSKSFFNSKSAIEQLDVFKLLQKMPKGAVLHAHDLSLGSADWLVSNLTYWNDLYMCNNTENKVIFRFFNTPDTSCDWKLAASERANYSSAEDFDNYLYSLFTINTPVPDIRYPDINSVWNAANDVFLALSGLLTYRGAFVTYFNEVLQEFMDDGISYLEFRGVLDPLYEKDGRLYTQEETVAVYRSVATQFVSRNANFYAVRFIYAPIRLVNVSDVWNYVDSVIQLRNLFPNFVAGFDLVGQEDKGRPLIDFIDPLLTLGAQEPPIPVFYHAGETDWEGLSTDENLFDAFLLNASRIGHGYAITKHPSLVQLGFEMDIPVEVCPISNQVLMLVNDLRNHPAASLAANSYPMVVASDDRTLWDAAPLSHDFYEAFMGIGGAKADLRFLKKLILNSIRYSSLSLLEKYELEALWQSQWDAFITENISNKTEERNVASEILNYILYNENFIDANSIQ